MSFVNVTVRRKDELFAKLKKLAPAVEKALVVSNGKAAVDMVTLARQFAPVRTGALRDSIVATAPGGLPPVHSQGARVVPPGAFMVTAGSDRVRYAHLVEFGTAPHVNQGMMPGTLNPGAPAQPYFFPAYRLIRKGMKNRATRAINQSIKAVVR